MAELIRDRSRARKKLDQNADVCFLATSDVVGDVHVRTLVVREIVDRTVGIFLAEGSPKWQQLQEGGRYELLIYYPTMDRQYRLSGGYHGIDTELVADSWQLRPAASKYLDYYYARTGGQSTISKSRQDLIEGIGAVAQSVGDPDALVAPSHARGLHLEVNRVDRLDLTDPSSVHDRRLFTYSGGAWRQETLVP